MDLKGKRKAISLSTKKVRNHFCTNTNAVRMLSNPDLERKMGSFFSSFEQKKG